MDPLAHEAVALALAQLLKAGGCTTSGPFSAGLLMPTSIKSFLRNKLKTKSPFRRAAAGCKTRCGGVLREGRPF